MRFSIKALAAAMALAIGASSAHAEIYTMYTGPGDLLPSTGSSLGLSLQILGAPPVGILFNVPPASLTGSAVVDMNLDSTNSGTLILESTTLDLGTTEASQSGSLFGIFPYSIAIRLKGVGVNVQAGPITVTNGVFSIDNTTLGTLSIVDGSGPEIGFLEYDIVISSLGINEVGVLSFGPYELTQALDGNGDPILDQNGDFTYVPLQEEDDEGNPVFDDEGNPVYVTEEPLVVEISSLPPGVTIPGTADDDAGGVDNGDGSPHNIENIPGLTGLSSIDNDGAEVTLAFNGVGLTSALDLDGIPLPLTISLNGGIAVGVPEIGSMSLAGLVLVGTSSLAIIRRRRNG